MISSNPREDRALKMMAGTMLAMMVTLTSLRACHAFRPGGPLCAAINAFRIKAIHLLAERNAR